jgi:YfiH family protein
MNHPPFSTHEALVHPSLAHGFFGRNGGVSTGLYASLNAGIGSRDDAAHVAENRARIAQAISGSRAVPLLSLYQVHSPTVLTVDAPFTGDRPQADALVTRTPNLVLGILTADCGPVLFADPHAGVIGAAHAGWKGAHSGVLEQTIAAMEALGATRRHIAAVLGPCIHQPSYEVGSEFLARFTAEAQHRFFSAGEKPEKYQFDLPAYILARLRTAGIAQVAQIAHDTCADAARYFSYRRSTLHAEPDYGRQVSAILRKE